MKIISYLSYLSFEVVFGACAMCYLVTRWFNYDLDLNWYFLLGSAVWIIYTLDHLWDAKSREPQFLPDRHLFHLKYFNILVYTLIFVVIATAIDAFQFLNTDQWKLLGFCLLGCGVYFVLNIYLESIFLMKELIISFLYTIGISFPILAQPDLHLHLPDYLFLGMIFFTAWLNLLAFAKISINEDQISKFKSLALVMGVVGLKRIFVVSAFVYCILFILNVFFHYNDAMFYIMILVSIGLVQMMIFIFSNKETPLKVLRLVGDMVFMLPFFLLLF